MFANIAGVTKHVSVKFKSEGCAAGKSGFQGCTLCERACRHGAITRRGDKIEFDEISCKGCGACASVCPLSLFRIDDEIYSRMENLLGSRDSRSDRGILIFTCGHGTPLLDAMNIKYPAVLPVHDLASVSENHILRAFDLGAESVIILGCPECIGNDIHEAWGFAERILEVFNLNGRLRVINNDNDVKSLAGSLRSVNELRAGTHEPVMLKNTFNRRILIELISSLAEKTGIIPCAVIEDPELPFADISIGSSCTVCGACTSMCSTGALARDAGIISSVYSRCIACGMCEKACPEKALKMRKVFDMSKLLDTEPSILFKSELQVCASCRKPYMTRAAFDRISESFIENVRDDLGCAEQIELIKNRTELLQYCENCRPAKAVLKMGALL